MADSLVGSEPHRKGYSLLYPAPARTCAGMFNYFISKRPHLEEPYTSNYQVAHTLQGVGVRVITLLYFQKKPPG